MAMYYKCGGGATLSHHSSCGSVNLEGSTGRATEKKKKGRQEKNRKKTHQCLLVLEDKSEKPNSEKWRIKRIIWHGKCKYLEVRYGYLTATVCVF